MDSRWSSGVLWKFRYIRTPCTQPSHLNFRSDAKPLDEWEHQKLYITKYRLNKYFIVCCRLAGKQCKWRHATKLENAAIMNGNKIFIWPRYGNNKINTIIFNEMFFFHSYRHVQCATFEFYYSNNLAACNRLLRQQTFPSFFTGTIGKKNKAPHQATGKFQSCGRQRRTTEIRNGIRECAFIHLIETVESAGRVINFPFRAGPELEYVYIGWWDRRCAAKNVRVCTFYQKKFHYECVCISVRPSAILDVSCFLLLYFQ